MPVIRIAATLSLCFITAAHADTTATTISLPGGPSAVGAFTLSSVYGQSTSLGVMSAANIALTSGFLCVEADDIGNLGDLNNDGQVNGVDLAIILNNWGICGLGTCPADIDRDGLVNGVDLAIVLSNWG
jgi:hypothetical protein